MDDFILNEIKKMEGTLLRIGLHNEKFKTAINKNAKIIIYISKQLILSF